MVIYTSDMMRLTGRSERTVRRWIAAIRKEPGRKKNTLITIQEFCAYTGYDPEKIAAFIQ